MSLVQEVADLALRMSTECKSLRTLINGNGADLSSLTTTAKNNLVAALNEVRALAQSAASSGGAQINDAVTNLTTVWSSQKVSDQITSAISALTSGAPAALNTIDELAAALNDVANQITTILTALGNRVRTDTAAQGLTTQQKTNARTNIDAASATEVGDTTTDFVAIFEAGLTA